MPTPARRRQSAWRGDAALGDDDRVGGNERRQPLADFERGLEGPEVAVVDADQPAFERQRALEFGLVVDLDQHVEAEVVRGLVERARRLVVDRRHDDEDAVGAPGARLQHLIGIEEEILAQDRQRRRRARLDQMLRVALETTARR